MGQEKSVPPSWRSGAGVRSHWCRSPMGRFITRLRPGDRELQERLVEEARSCYSSAVPMSEAVARLVELAGDNPNAFQGMGGKDARDLVRTADGQAILRLIGLADSTRSSQNRVGVQRMVGQRRTPEEKRLASMPVDDGFNLLAERDPQLGETAQDVVRAAEDARINGEDHSGVRRAVDTVVDRALDMTGPSATVHSGLATRKTARQVVTTHLYEIADVNVLDIESNDWPGGSSSQGGLLHASKCQSGGSSKGG
jgi:hypothetical protein